MMIDEQEIVYIQIRRLKDKSPNISPTNTINKTDAEDIKKFLGKALIKDAINAEDPLTCQTIEEAKEAKEELICIITEDEITYWLMGINIISQVKKQLNDGRHLFNVTITIATSGNMLDDNKTVTIKLNETIWKEQLLRQASGRSEIMSDFFYRHVGFHNVYKRDLRALSQETLSAVRRYIEALGRYLNALNASKAEPKEQVVNDIDSIFDQHYYGFKPGPFFTEEQAANCLSMKTPTGDGLLPHLLGQDLGRRTPRSQGVCIKHFLIPQLKNIFFPEFEPERSLTLSPLYKTEIRLSSKTANSTPTLENQPAPIPLKKREIEDVNTTVSETKRYKTPTGRLARGESEEAIGAAELIPGPSRTTETGSRGNQSSVAQRPIKAARKGYNACDSMGKKGGKKR